jgi:hypothetical protein
MDMSFADRSLPEIDWNPVMPTPGQKVYCAYWLRNGECGFTQTGCLFKHVMPMKLEVLEACGLRDLPDWFRKTVHCGSLRINGGRNGLNFGITPNNISVVLPPPAPKPVFPVGPRARLDAEASRRAIAAHINSMPMRSGIRAAVPRQSRPGNGNNHTNKAAANSRAQRAYLTDAERAEERDRRDKRMAAAFDADLESNACTDMMDAEMERIRNKEQAGWEEEQNSRLAATGAAATGSNVGKKGDARTNAANSNSKAEKQRDPSTSASTTNSNDKEKEPAKQKKKTGRSGGGRRRSPAHGKTLASE